jgi:hypothetical protein
MLTWKQFAAERPELATAGRRMFYQHGLGLGHLATVRPDDGPRVHPICPVLTEDSLYGLIVPGPKLHDLRRDPRSSLNSETCPPPHHDDAFYVSGVVEERSDARLWEQVADQVLTERNLSEPWADFDRQTLFEFMIATCLVTMTLDDDVLPAGHTVWRDQRAHT